MSAVEHRTTHEFSIDGLIDESLSYRLHLYHCKELESIIKIGFHNDRMAFANILRQACQHAVQSGGAKGSNTIPNTPKQQCSKGVFVKTAE